MGKQSLPTAEGKKRLGAPAWTNRSVEEQPKNEGRDSDCPGHKETDAAPDALTREEAERVPDTE